MKFIITLLFLLGSSGCSQPTARPFSQQDTRPSPPPSLHLLSSTDSLEEPESSFPDTTSFQGLDDLLTEALRSNPGLASHKAAWMAAKAQVEQARGYPDPSIGLAGFISPLETRNGPTQARLNFRQTVPWPSELDAREDGATAKAAAEFCKWESASLEVQEQLKQTWWELAFVHRAIDLIGQTLELVITTEKSLHSKLEVGRTSFANVIRIEVERAKLEDSLLSYQDRVNPLRDHILHLLGTTDQKVEWPIPSFATDLILKPSPSLPDAPILHHPDLLELSYWLVAATADLKVAKTLTLPSMTVGMEWTVIGDGPTLAPDSGEDALAASINFSLPLHQSRYAEARREAEARITQYIQLQRDRDLQLRSQLSEAAFQYRNAERRISLYRDQLSPKTERGFEVALSAFESGNESFETLLGTLRSVLDFQIEAARAESERAQALAKIERRYGQPIPMTTPETLNSDGTVKPLSAQETEE